MSCLPAVVKFLLTSVNHYSIEETQNKPQILHICILERNVCEKFGLHHILSPCVVPVCCYPHPHQLWSAVSC